MSKKSLSKINIPTTIRFNPNEDNIQDVSSISQEHFHRRANSAEDITCSVQTSQSLPTTAPIASGTWNIIKGKVSQAMGDMKSSSKSDSTPKKTSPSRRAGGDSDDDSTEDRSDRSSDSETENLRNDIGENVRLSSTKKSLGKSDVNKCERDGSSPLRPSRLFRKKFGMSPKMSPRIVKSFDATPDKHSASPSSEIRRRILSKPDILQSEYEIESGIEITEEMMLSCNQRTEGPENVISIGSSVTLDQDDDSESNEKRPCHALVNFFILVWRIFFTMVKSLRFTFICISLVKAFAFPQFLQGFLCSSCMALDLMFFVKHRNEKYLLRKNVYSAESLGIQPKKSPQCKNDKSNITKQNRAYSGWMTEIKTYDPATFHLAMTRTVFVRLDGSKLRLSSYMRRSGSSERIPKRAYWNETPIAQQDVDNDTDSESSKKVTLTNHRYYDLNGSDIKMLPLGLARKRYFSRKYPIQITTNKSHVKMLNRDNHVEINWFDLEEIKKVSKTFLEKERQYEVAKESEISPVAETSTIPPPQLILFARCDREKEDWYRRFYQASIGFTSDYALSQTLDAQSDLDCSQFTDLVMINSSNLQSLRLNESPSRVERKSRRVSTSLSDSNLKEAATRDSYDERKRIEDSYVVLDDLNRIPNIGLLMTSCALRGPADYIKFMSKYQSRRGPLRDGSESATTNNNSNQSTNNIDERNVALETISDIVWMNILTGRIFYSCLKDTHFVTSLTNLLQKKLEAIKLPPFMESICVTNVDLGESVPVFDNIIPPMCDERGLWLEADISYEGLMIMTISTKLNLMRLKKVEQSKSIQSKKGDIESDDNSDDNDVSANMNSDDEEISDKKMQFKAKASIYDSDAESSGASSTDSDSMSQSFVDIRQTISDTKTKAVDVPKTTSNNTSTTNGTTNSSGNSRKLLRIVDRIAASNLFQSATEIPYVQRAMKNMSTDIRLRFELKGISGRIVFNIPPPPSDRIWMTFRHPPKMQMSATPAVGDHTFDWDIVTSTIESKLYEEILKFLVYPNMVDVVLPILGPSTYKETAKTTTTN